tara:strand:- start:24604 stop:24927 length:324 start_codon:yes stop_codon:yes gene_type:complete
MNLIEDDFILKIKPFNYDEIYCFDPKIFNKKYNNHDVILIIEFNVDKKFLSLMINWQKYLNKNKILILVCNNLNIDLYNNDIIILSNEKEAFDYIKLERITRGLSIK